MGRIWVPRSMQKFHPRLSWFCVQASHHCSPSLPSQVLNCLAKKNLFGSIASPMDHIHREVAAWRGFARLGVEGGVYGGGLKGADMGGSPGRRMATPASPIHRLLAADGGGVGSRRWEVDEGGCGGGMMGVVYGRGGFARSRDWGWKGGVGAFQHTGADGISLSRRKLCETSHHPPPGFPFSQIAHHNVQTSSTLSHREEPTPSAVGKTS